MWSKYLSVYEVQAVLQVVDFCFYRTMHVPEVRRWKVEALLNTDTEIALTIIFIKTLIKQQTLRHCQEINKCLGGADSWKLRFGL